MDAVGSALGPYFDTFDIEYFNGNKISSAGKGADQSLSRKRYCRLAVSSEAPKNMDMNDALIKKISGGDIVDPRNLYSSEAVKFKPAFSLHFLTNHDIDIDVKDPAIVRRLRVIQYENKFTDVPKGNEKQRNNSLKEKLTELPEYKNAVMNVLLKYHTKYINNNKILKMPEKIMTDTNKYIYENDPLAEFVTMKLEITKDDKDVIQSSILYTEFKNYYDNPKKIISTKRFKELLTEYDGIKPKITNSCNFFSGVKFNDSDN
jgi:phage/plasmid-associated DNA primase